MKIFILNSLKMLSHKDLIKNTVYIDLYDANHFVILLKIFAISKFPLLSDTINGVFFSLCFFRHVFNIFKISFTI